ncbi:hypothetical protein PUN28_017275 [Cardiocondyla obscurior]
MFLRRFKRIGNGTINNAACFNISSSVSPYSASSYSKNVARDFTLDNQQSKSNNTAIKFSSRVQSNSFIVSHILLRNERTYVKCKPYHSGQYYNSIRYVSNSGINSVAEVQDPTQFSGIFKVISESAPVKVAQDSLLFMHDYTGLPWWLVIVLTTVMIRTVVTLPLSFYQLYILAKLENLKCEMDETVKEIKKEINYGMCKYNWSKKYTMLLYKRSVKKQWNKLIVQENCHPAKASLVVLVQIPLWISLSMSIRNLCYMLPKQDASAHIIYQQLTTDGFLWISNLTEADPFVLPIVMALLNLAIIEITYITRVQKSTRWQKYLTNFFRIVTIGMIPIAMSVPSCLSLYWTTSSAFGLFQNLILLSPKLRRLTKVPTTTSELQHPYLQLRDKLAAKCRLKRKVEVPPKV